MKLEMRLAIREDLDGLAALVVRANATYQVWAGGDWRPPGVAHERSRWRERFDDGAAWNAVALANDQPSGCVSFTDAHDLSGKAVPGLAHLSRLFVDPGLWGRGIGGLLLTSAVDEMRRRGYERAQLFTATGNIRSRRFYEHHSWCPGDQTRRWQGLDLVQYRLEL